MSAFGMPSDLLKYFQPRPQLPYIPYRRKRPHRAYSGVFDLLSETPDLFEKAAPPTPEPYVDLKQRKEAERRARIDRYNKELRAKVALYSPNEGGSNKTKDPYNTIFIARLNYDTTERTLKRELEAYGNILSMFMVKDLDGEPRGYAFVEYETESSLKAAYNSLNKRVIDGWKILVDVERGRTVENWLPKRLGGGKGQIRGIEKVESRKRGADYTEDRHRKRANFGGGNPAYRGTAGFGHNRHREQRG
ncbi:U1 snrp Snp1p RRM domain containing protein, partial [Cryptosporidium ryanae]|uniref:U1 snrp Snp1p RRM domain containing protein n=1 Tax=Cryptosporidium ryanae TaxID=515981 RepID=UPI003519E32D